MLVSNIKIVAAVKRGAGGGGIVINHFFPPPAYLLLYTFRLYIAVHAGIKHLILG